MQEVEVGNYQFTVAVADDEKVGDQRRVETLKHWLLQEF